MIDCGIASSPAEYIFPYLKQVGIEEVSFLINTHGHQDHMGGSSYIKENSKAKVAAHELDVPWIENHALLLKEFVAKYDIYFPLNDKAISEFYKSVGKECKVDMILKDGAIIPVDGSELKVIHTPGHTKGSICLYEPSERILFTSDAVQGTGLSSESYNFKVLPVYMDAEAYFNSLNRLKEMNIELALMAHDFEPFKRRVLKGEEFREYLNLSLNLFMKMDELILKILEDGPYDLLALTKIISDKITEGKGILWNDIYIVDAHLQRLLKGEKVSYSEGKYLR